MSAILDSQALQRQSLQSTLDHEVRRRQAKEAVLREQIGDVGMVLARMYADAYAREAVTRDALERMGWVLEPSELDRVNGGAA